MKFHLVSPFRVSPSSELPTQLSSALTYSLCTMLLFGAGMGCLGNPGDQGLSLLRTLPRHGELSVSTRTDVEMEFDSPISNSGISLQFTFAKRGFYQQRAADEIQGDFVFRENRLIFSPRTPLALNTRYVAILRQFPINGSTTNSTVAPVPLPFSSFDQVSQTPTYTWEFATKPLEVDDGLQVFRLDPVDFRSSRTTLTFGTVRRDETLAVIPLFGTQTTPAGSTAAPIIRINTVGAISTPGLLEPDSSSTPAGSGNGSRSLHQVAGIPSYYFGSDPSNVLRSDGELTADSLANTTPKERLQATLLDHHRSRLNLISNETSSLLERIRLSPQLATFFDRRLDNGPRFVQQGRQFRPFGHCRPPYTVGETGCNFTVLNYEDHEVQIETLLAYESAEALWFVQTDHLDELTRADFEGLARFLGERAIPSNSRYFGNLPDSDFNNKIIVVFTSHLIRPGAPHGVVGYVAPWDLAPNDEMSGLTSNEGDIFYATLPSSVASLSYTKPDYLQRLMPSTIVHELKHLVAVASRLSRGMAMEPAWLEEPTAVASEQLVGLGTESGSIQRQARYALSRPENFRVRYENPPRAIESRLSLYGYNFLFFWNLGVSIGHGEFWKAIVNSTSSDLATVYGASRRTMEENMSEFALKLFLDGDTRFPAYQLEGVNLRDGTWRQLGVRGLDSTQTMTVGSAGYLLGKGVDEDVTLQFEALNSTTPSVLVLRIPGSPASWPHP